MSEGAEPTRTVFVVDDDASVRRALDRLFRHAGYAVRTFASAEEFLLQDLGDEQCCVIADVHLGGMRGFDLHAELRQRNHPMRVILFSGVESAAADAAVRNFGVTEFFRKPFEVERLMDVVSRSFGQSALSEPLLVEFDSSRPSTGEDQRRVIRDDSTHA
jgi:FixJ family two-component response regulator